MTFKLIPQTDQWMTRKRIRMGSKGTLYPSEASVAWVDPNGLNRVSGACMRSSYLRVTGKADDDALPIDAYTEWIFALGKAVEIILVEQWKQMGIWVDNNLEFYDKARNLSGEIDCLIRDPETGELVLCEVKSFYGYNATKQICGNKSTTARPKTSQMMQTLIYVDQFKEHISYAKMIYYARDSASRKEFDIRLSEDGHPLINGVIDHRFTLQDIYSRYDQLTWHIENEQLPEPDYELVWGPEKVLERNALGEVAKTNFEKWQKKPDKNPIGDWNCSYCRYKYVCWPGGKK